MEAEARYTWVGAVVLGLLAALVAGIVWLKNVGSKGEFNRYVIHFEHQALDGLEVGAAVTLRGIKVGRVEDYALADAQLKRVRVEIRVDRRAPAYTGTVAVVTRNFVTGIAQITLVNEDPPGELLAKVPEGEEYPVIGEGRSNLEEIAGRVNEVGEIASTTLNSLNRLLSAENRQTVMDTVRSLRDLANGINTRLGTLDTTLQRVGQAATQVGGAATRIAGTAATFTPAAAQIGQAAQQLGEAGTRVAGVADRGLARLDSTLADTEKAIAEAQRAFGQVAIATQALEKQATATAQRLENTAISVDDQLGATLAELRASIDTATRVLDRLRDPRAALLGPDKTQLGPGEKMP